MEIQIRERLDELLREDAKRHASVTLSVAEFEPWLRLSDTPFFPEYTEHGPRHVSNTLATASAIIRDEAWPVITPADVEALALSVLLHDCALDVSEDGFLSLVKPETSRQTIVEFDDLPWPALWLDFLREASRFDSRKLTSLFGDTTPAHNPGLDAKLWTSRDKLLIGEFLRRHQRTGKRPQELIFDSRLTTHADLNRLNQRGIDFMTLHRRSPQMLHQIHQLPPSAWRRIQLSSISREFRTPRILDQRITLSDYEGLIRQLVIADLGHEEPTFLLTNQLHRSAPQLIQRYAQRMIIENGIADGIDFFHMDALSSAVAMKIDCDLQLTLMASSLYRLLALKVGNGYQHAHSRHLFRDFVDAPAVVAISGSNLEVRFQKRAHNPLLMAAGFDQTEEPIPWLDNKRLRLTFG